MPRGKGRGQAGTCVWHAVSWLGACIRYIPETISTSTQRSICWASTLVWRKPKSHATCTLHPHARMHAPVRAYPQELLKHPWLAESGTAVRKVPDTVVQRLQQFAAMTQFKREARKVWGVAKCCWRGDGGSDAKGGWKRHIVHRYKSTDITQCTHSSQDVLSESGYAYFSPYYTSSVM